MYRVSTMEFREEFLLVLKDEIVSFQKETQPRVCMKKVSTFPVWENSQGKSHKILRTPAEDFPNME